MPRQLANALKQAYDVGAIIRGAFQIALVLAAGMFAWNQLENVATSNRERLIAVESTTRAHSEQLAQLPMLSMTTTNLQAAVDRLNNRMTEAATLRETIATLTERIEGLRSQVVRLEQVISRQQSSNERTRGLTHNGQR